MSKVYKQINTIDGIASYAFGGSGGGWRPWALPTDKPNRPGAPERPTPPSEASGPTLFVRN